MTQGPVEGVDGGRLYLEAYVDTKGVTRALQSRLNAELAASNVRAKIKAQIDTRGGLTEARKAAAEITKAARDSVRVRLRAAIDTRGLVGEVRAAAAEASQAAVVTMRAQVDQASVAAAKAQIQAATGDERVDVDVDADTTGVDEEVEAVRRRAKAKPITLDVKLTQAGNALTSLAAIPAMAGGFYLLNAAIVNVGGGLVAMASSAASAAGALAVIPNLIGVAVQGVGALVAGFSGVGEAVGALGQAEQQGAQVASTAAASRAASAERVRAAQQAVGDAVRAAGEQARQANEAISDAQWSLARSGEAVVAAREALSDANYNAAQAAEAAAERIIAAEENVGEAQRAVAQAQRGLTQAREDARDRIEDLNTALRLSALDEESAMAALQRARENLQDVRWNSAASPQERRDAEMAVKEAEAQVERVKVRNEDLADTVREANKEGVKGSNEVRSAQQNLTSAQEAQRDAVEEVTAAREDSRRSAIESARSIRDAEYGVRDALHAQQEAREGLADAERAQATGAASSARAIADAQRALQQAQQAGTDAAVQQTAAQQNLATAMDNLSPAGRRFALFIANTLLPRLKEMRLAIQETLLPPVQRGIEAALPFLDTLETGLVDTAGRIGAFAERLGRLLGSKTFNTRVGEIMASNNRALSNFLDALYNLIPTLSRIAKVAGPVLLEPFAKWTREVTRGWREAARLNEESGAMEGWFKKVGGRAALLGDIFGNLAMALFGIGKAATPTGDSLLESFEKTTRGWAKFANSDLGQARMAEFFEATEPVTKALGDLVAQLTEMFFKLGESGGGPVTMFLNVLTSMVNGINSLLSLPNAGPVIGWIFTLAGAGGALGLVSGMFLKMAGNIGRLVRIIPGGGAALRVLGTIAKNVGRLMTAALGAVVRMAGRAAAALAKGLWRAMVSVGKAAGRAAAAIGKALWRALVATARAAGRAAAAVGRALWRALTAAARAAGRAAAAIGRALWRALMATVRAAGRAAVALGKALWRALMATVRAAGRAAAALARALFAALMGTVRAAGRAAVALGRSLVRALILTAGAAGRAARAMLGLLGSLLRAAGAALASAARIVAHTAALVAQRVATIAVSVATRTMAAAQWLLNAALLANPIGLVIAAIVALIAIFVVLYKKNAAFRALVNKVWGAIKGAIIGAWNKIKPIFKNLLAGVKNLGKTISWLWEKAVKPAWAAIQRAISIMWNNYYKPILKNVWDALKTLGGWMKWLYDKAIKPAWNSIERAIEYAWDRVIKPTFNRVNDFIRNTLGPVFSWLYDKVIKPVWTNIRGFIDRAWTDYIKPTLERLNRFITETVPNAFRDGVDAIKNFWEDLKDIASRPVKFIVGTVWNDGLRKMINAIPGVPDMGEISTAGFARGTSNVGSVLPGYTPGRDVHRFRSADGKMGLDLSGGEAIMRPEWTKVFGTKAVDTMNAAARRGTNALRKTLGADGAGRLVTAGQRVGNKMMGYADGGILRFATGGVNPMPGATMTNFHGSNYLGTGAWAGDYNGPGGGNTDENWRAVAWKAGQVIAALWNGEDGSYGNRVEIDHGGSWTRYAHLNSIKVAAGDTVRQGQTIGLVGGTGNDGGSAHLHFEIMGGTAPTSGGASVGAGNGGLSLAQIRRQKAITAGKDERGDWLDRIKTVLGAVKNIPSWVNRLRDSMGKWGPTIATAAKVMGEKAQDWVNAKIPNSIEIPGPNLGLPDNPVNIFDQGGDWRTGQAGINLSGKTETVFTNTDMVDLGASLSATAMALRAMITTRDTGGSDGPLIGELTIQGRPEDVPDMLSAANFEMRRLRRGGVHGKRTAGSPA